MAQTGFTPIQLYNTSTATAVPVNTNLVNGELAINITDEKLYFKNAAGTVKLLASNAASATTFSAGTTGLTPSTATAGAVTLAGTLAVANGGTGVATSTGTGSTVLSTSPTLITPALGTPTALVGTNITGTAAAFNINGTVGATTPATGAFTSVNYTTTLTGGTGVVNLGSGQLVKDASGNVGIGTSSPGAKLQVTGGYSTLGDFNSSVTGTSPPSTGSSFGNNITNGQAESDIWNGFDPATYVNTGILFCQRLTASTRRDLMFLHNNGNVGIGTNSPTVYSGFTTLEVGASGNAGLFSAKHANGNALMYNVSGGAYFGSTGPYPTAFISNSNERMRIDTSGNVGIGTSSPADKLEIGGAGAGIILASPNGTRFRITVSNLGVLVVAAV